MPDSRRAGSRSRPDGGSGAGFPVPSPGFPLYFAYRSYWKKARAHARAEGRGAPSAAVFPAFRGRNRGRPRRDALLPDMEPYLMVQGNDGRRMQPEVMVSTGSPITLPPGHPQARRSSCPRGDAAARRHAAGDAWSFAAYRESADGIVLQKPEDPMAEQVLVPGDPETISRAERAHGAQVRDRLRPLHFPEYRRELPLVFVLLSLLIR